MRCTHPYMSSGHIRVRMTHIEPQASLKSVSVAVLGELRRRRWPVITKYELFRLLWDIYEHPEHYPTKILKRAAVPHKRQYERLALELLASNARLLRQDPDFAAYSPSLPHVFSDNRNSRLPRRRHFLSCRSFCGDRIPVSNAALWVVYAATDRTDPADIRADGVETRAGCQDVGGLWF